MGGVIYGSSWLAAIPPATAVAAGISIPIPLCADDRLDLGGAAGSLRFCDVDGLKCQQLYSYCFPENNIFANIT